MHKPAGLSALLRLLEETIPLQHITIQNSETPDMQPGPFERIAEPEVREVMRRHSAPFLALRLQSHRGPHPPRRHVAFRAFPALLQTLEEENDNL